MNAEIMNQDIQMLGELFKLREIDAEEELKNEKQSIHKKYNGLLKRIREEQ